MSRNRNSSNGSSPRAQIDYRPMDLRVPTDNKGASRRLFGDEAGGFDGEVVADIISTIERYDASIEAAREEFERFRGLSRAKAQLMAVFHSVETEEQPAPGKNPHFNSVLLHGPPGTGKTEIAFTLAKMSGAVFFRLQGSSFASEYQGRQEKLVKGLFDLAKICRHKLVVFIDECDDLLGKKKSTDHQVNTAMKCTFMNGLSALERENGTRSSVVFIGATNYPFHLEDAVIRRFKQRLHMPIPQSNEARLAILKDCLKTREHSIDLSGTDSDFEALGPAMKGFSGDDIISVLRKLDQSTQEARAAAYFLGGGINVDESPSISIADLVRAVDHSRSSVSDKIVSENMRFHERYGGGDDDTDSHRDELKKREQWLRLLIHSSSCASSSSECHLPNCTKMKNMLQHYAICQVKAYGYCMDCGGVASLLQAHAHRCVNGQCPVPNCPGIRKGASKMGLSDANSFASLWLEKHGIIAAKEAELEKATKRITNLEQDLKTAKDSTNVQRKADEERINEKDGIINAKKAEIEKATKCIAKLDAEIEKATKCITKRITKLEQDLKTAKDSANVQRKADEERINEKDGIIDAKEAELEKATKRITNLEQDLKTAKAASVHHEEENAQLKVDNENAKVRIAKLQEVNRQLMKKSPQSQGRARGTFNISSSRKENGQCMDSLVSCISPIPATSATSVPNAYSSCVIFSKNFAEATNSSSLLSDLDSSEDQDVSSSARKEENNITAFRPLPTLRTESSSSDPSFPSDSDGDSSDEEGNKQEADAKKVGNDSSSPPLSDFDDDTKDTELPKAAEEDSKKRKADVDADDTFGTKKQAVEDPDAEDESDQNEEKKIFYPGHVCKDVQYYFTLNNETPKIIAEKLGCDQKDIIADNEDYFRGKSGLKLYSTSRLEEMACIKIPKSRKAKLVLELQHESHNKLDFCAVCDKIEYTEGPDFIFCSKCDKCFHQSCVQIFSSAEIPEGDWYCKSCPSDDKKNSGKQNEEDNDDNSENQISHESRQGRRLISIDSPRRSYQKLNDQRPANDSLSSAPSDSLTSAPATNSCWYKKITIEMDLLRNLNVKIAPIAINRETARNFRSGLLCAKSTILRKIGEEIMTDQTLKAYCNRFCMFTEVLRKLIKENEKVYTLENHSDLTTDSFIKYFLKGCMRGCMSFTYGTALGLLQRGELTNLDCLNPT